MSKKITHISSMLVRSAVAKITDIGIDSSAPHTALM
jgi:hypothetical protein